MAVNVGQRNVPDTPQYRGLKANELALKLSIHTIKITSNPKVFDDKYQKVIDKIVDCAVNIQMSSWTANNIRVGDDHEKKEWNNAKRMLREHKKKGKSLFGDYCYFVGHFNLYSIVDFEYTQ